MISYKPLWKLLIDLDMSKTDLRIKAGISANTITRMGKGEEVSITVLNKILKALNLKNYDDIVEYIPFECKDNNRVKRV